MNSALLLDIAPCVLPTKPASHKRGEKLYIHSDLPLTHFKFIKVICALNCKLHGQPRISGDADMALALRCALIVTSLFSHLAQQNSKPFSYVPAALWDWEEEQRNPMNPEAPKPLTNLRSGEASDTVESTPGSSKKVEPAVKHDSLKQTEKMYWLWKKAEPKLKGEGNKPGLYKEDYNEFVRWRTVVVNQVRERRVWRKHRATLIL